mmetsp:Transcript_21731/g.69978  ORF Transcript_21731/g.69978 Transcript_21731/m.69978 type:complete len:257 (-) Transcript_21731:172-942(-)
MGSRGERSFASRLRDAHESVRATDPRFWEKVGLKVGRSAEECHAAWFKDFEAKGALAAKDEKRRKDKAKKRVDRAEDAIQQAATFANNYEETSSLDRDKARKARAKLRRALEDLKHANESVPEGTASASATFGDNSIDAALARHRPLPSPRRRRGAKEKEKDEAPREEEEEPPRWKPESGYVAALRKKRRKPHEKKRTLDKLKPSQRRPADVGNLIRLQRQLDDATRAVRAASDDDCDDLVLLHSDDEDETTLATL